MGKANSCLCAERSLKPSPFPCITTSTSPPAPPSLPGGGTMMQPSIEQSDAEIGRFEVQVAITGRSLLSAESEAVLNPAVWERASGGSQRTRLDGRVALWACVSSLSDQHMASIACEGGSCIHTTYHGDLAIPNYSRERLKCSGTCRGRSGRASFASCYSLGWSTRARTPSLVRGRTNR